MSQEIANLQINIADNSRNASEEVKKLASSLKSLNKVKNPENLERYSQALQTFAQSLGGLKTVTKQLNNMASASAKLANALALAKNSLSVISNKGFAKQTEKATEVSEKAKDYGMGTKSASVVKEQIEETTQATKESTQAINEMATKSSESLGKIASGWNKVKDGVSKVKELSASAVKSFSNTMKSLPFAKIANQFTKLMKLKVLRSIANEVLRGFSEGLQNVYHWATLTGNQFASSMDTIATSTKYLRNSIGASLTSLLNTLAPIIDSVVDMLVTAINYVNMFFASLSGSTTYTKAKKNITAWGEATQNAVGGASGAVKELKEELSVLDFDELNQLAEQATPSSGGGGGGGGSSAPNYADMFEEAEVTSKVKDIANGIKAHFDDILETVKLIGVAILAWKVSSAMSKIFDNFSMKQAVGLTMAITGFTLEYDSAVSLGENGFNLKDLIKTAIGSAMGVAGSVLVFGSNPLGWTVGIGLAIYTFITGFSMGNLEKIKANLSETSEAYQMALLTIQGSEEGLVKANELLERAKKATIENTEGFKNIAIGQKIIDELKQYNSLLNPTQTQMDRLNALTKTYNELGLGEITAQWDIVNGRIQTNATDLQKSIDKYKEMLYLQASQEVLEANTKIQVEAELEISNSQEVQNEARAMIQQLYSELGTVYAPQNVIDYIAGSGVMWMPGDAIPTVSPWITEEQRSKMVEIDSWQNVLNTEIDRQLTLNKAIETAQKNIDNVFDKMYGTSEVISETPKLIESSMSESERILKGYSPLIGTASLKTGQAVVNGMNVTSEVEIDAKEAVTTYSDTINTAGLKINGTQISKDTSNAILSVKEGFASTGLEVATTISTNIDNGLKSSASAVAKSMHTTYSANIKNQGWKQVGELSQYAMYTGFTDLQAISAEAGAKVVRDSWAYEMSKQNFRSIGENAGSAIASGIASKVGGTFTAKVTTSNGTTTAGTLVISGYANGGFVDGDLFIANERGAEMVGTVGGRTAVANNDQIASAIAKALTPMLSGRNDRTEITNIDIYLDNRVVARASARGQQAMNKQFNLTAMA